MNSRSIATADGTTPDEALRLTAAMKHDAEHPVARAIVRSAEERALAIPSLEDFEYVPGRGVRATVEGRPYRAEARRYPTHSARPADAPLGDLNEQGIGETATVGSCIPVLPLPANGGTDRIPEPRSFAEQALHSRSSAFPGTSALVAQLARGWRMAAVGVADVHA